MAGSSTAPPRLDSATVRGFHEVGFIVLPDLFTADEVAQLREAFARLERTARGLGQSGDHRGSRFVLDPLAGGGVRIQRVVWCGAAEPVLLRYGADPKLLGVASQLLGSRTMSQLINQAHFKLPGDGVAFPWHQDSTHRRYGQPEWQDVNGRGSYVQTVLALDDVTADNGPLRFMPGSSRLGHVEVPEDGDVRRWVDPARVVAPTMQAGSVLAFGPYVFHSSEPNQSQRPRRTLINGYAAPGANSRVYPGVGSGRMVEAP